MEAASDPKTVQLTKSEKRWHWRTWNLLLQIRQATDGEDVRQRHGEMTERNLCVAHTPEMRAIHKRGWAEHVDTGELISADGNDVSYLPAWQITEAGREALSAAVLSGLTIQ